MQKRIVPEIATPPAADSQWINLEQAAHLQLTSEDPAHPFEAALRAKAPAGWRAAGPGPQSVRLSFYTPQVIRRVYVSIEADDQRTHEFVLRWSGDGGVTYREIVRQQYNFSAGARREEETYHPHLHGVTDLKLDIIPDISGGPAIAALQALRVG